MSTHRCLRPRAAWPLLAAALALSLGCTAIAEKVAGRLATEGFDVDHQAGLIEGDLTRLRQCLRVRGGSCQGGVQTALANSSDARAGRPATPVRTGASTTLAAAMAALPARAPARLAYDALRHPVTRQSMALHNHLRGHDGGDQAPGFSVRPAAEGGGSEVRMNLAIGGLSDFHDRLWSATAAGGWRALDETCAQLAAAPATAEAADEEQDARARECRIAAFVRGYVAAYFRNGELLQIDVDPAAVEAAVGRAASAAGADVAAAGARVEGTLSAPAEQVAGRVEGEIDTLAGKAKGAIASGAAKIDAGLSNVFRVSQVGFVSRDATFQAKLPSLQLTFEPGAKKPFTLEDLDSGKTVLGATDLADLGVVSDSSGVATGASIGAELVRVFLEALFDAHEGLPALALANPPGLRATGLTLGAESLPLYTAPLGNVSAQDFTAMTRFNDRVAAQTRVLLSRAVAGIGPFSLNNQALEDLIVEVITTSVRKAVEKASWCWYACNLDVDLEQARAELKAALERSAKQTEGDLRDAVERGAERVKARAESAADRVRLRLQISG